MPTPASAAPQYATLRPIDEGEGDAGFAAFRRELRSIVARRDAAALLAALSPDIAISFGGENGREAFSLAWNLPQGDSDVWSQLDAVLALGGTLSQGVFLAPYVNAAWPDEFDPFDYVAVTGRDVRVRARPTAEAPVMASLSYAIVRLAGQYQDRPWTAVQLADGRDGFIASRFVRSSIDYRAYFVQTDGRWQMAVFIAGD